MRGKKIGSNIHVHLICLISLWSTHVLAFRLVNPSAISYATPAGDQQVLVFATADDNSHLFAARYDGGWTWFDLGQPHPGVGFSYPNAITYPDSPGGQQIRVFGRASDGTLVADSWDGSAWQWFDLGLPSGIDSIYEINAITYVDAGGFRQVRVFAMGSAHYGEYQRLVADAWGGAWQWFDLGTTESQELVAFPSAVSYQDAAGDHVRVFTTPEGGRLGLLPHLVGDAWDGSNIWTWFDLGVPDGAADVTYANAVAYVDYEGNAQIHVFALADNGHLVMDNWYGFGWFWVDLGLPATVTAISPPKAITYPLGFGVQEVLVFTVANDGRLFGAAWNSEDEEWAWYDLGLGFGAEQVQNPTPISYVDESGVRQVLVFVEGSRGEILLDAWDGTSWTWSDLGQPQ